MRTTRLTGALSALLALAISIGPVHAQTATESAGLEEVVVTAEKVTSDLQKTPVSVATISGQELTEQGATDLSSALKDIPAVTIDTGPAGFLVRIRGAGLDVPPTVGSPQVAISRDGVFDGQILDTFLGFYDVNQIEVLRGPQGTLFGRSATGGAVNIETNDPVNKFEAGGVFEVGNYNLLHVDEMVNLPLNDDWSMRLAGTSVYHTGYLTNGENSADNKAGRFKLLYKPNEDTSLLIGAEEGVVGGNAAGLVDGWGQTQPSDPWKDTDPTDNYWTNRIQKYYVNFQQNVGFGELTVLPAYQWIDGTWHYHFGSFPAAPSHLHTTWDQDSVEARLASLPGSKITWVVGIYDYDNPERDQTNVLVDSYGNPLPDGLYPGTAPSYQSEIRGVRSEAVYGQVTYPILETLRVTGGLRESKDTETEWSEACALVLNVVLPPPQPPGPVCTRAGAGRVPNPGNPSAYYSYISAADSWSYVDFKAALEADLAPNSLGYLQVSSAHLPGGFNTNDNSEFQPERDVAYEVGSKNRFLNNTLQVNADVFDNQYTDYIVNLQSFNPAIGPLLSTGSAGARSYGAEVESNYLVTSKDLLNIGVAYLHARYGIFASPMQQQFNDSPIPIAPDWTITLGYQHTFDLGGGATLTPHVDTRYHSDYYLQPGYGHYNPPFFPANVDEEYAAHVSNARLIYRAASGWWDLTAHISNIENHATKETAFGPSLAISEPRTFGLALSAHYGGK
jgi:iron complex outermembrane receptor protein